MWQTVKLGDVAKFVRGLTYSKKDEVEIDGIGVLRATNIDLKSYKLTFNEIRYIDKAATVKPDKYARMGDILVCTASGSKSHLGKVALVEDDLDMAFGGFMAALRCEQNCSPEFLFLVLISKSFVTHLSSLSDGANINNLKFSQIEGFEFPLPPLAEQQRIVAKLDAAFAEIDTAVEATEESTRNVIGIYYSAVNRAFFDDKNINMKTQLERFIKVLTDYHANGSYEKLKENIELKDEKDFAWMMRSTDFENQFQNPFKYIDRNAYDFLSKSKVFEGDILMSKIGNAGKIYLVPSLPQPASLAMNLFLIRLDEEKIYNEFLFLYLQSDDGKKQIQQRLKGAVTKTITKDNVRSIEVPEFDLDSQKRIAEKLRTLDEKTNKLKSLYQLKIQLMQRLKVSVLKQYLSLDMDVAA